MNQGMRFFVRAYFLTTTALLFSGHASAQEAAPPVFSPGEGVYRTAQSISISDATVGAKIYYTIDGSEPTRASAEYTGGAITIGSTATLRALAMAPSDTQGARATAIYSIVPLAARPVFSLPEGAYRSAQTVSISDATAGATIYYTTDGTTPTTASAQYTGAMTVDSNQTFHAIAVAPGFSQSPTARAIYEIAPFVTPTPIFSPAAGAYSTAQTVSISDIFTGAPIYYTTDGTTPTTASTLYTGAIAVSSTETLRTIAAAAGRTQSAVASATYTFAPTESVLYFFGTGNEDGVLPRGGLIQGSDGNFYGTTEFGGEGGEGAVFKITPAGVESVLYSFASGTNYATDGFYPWAPLIQASDGNFYGTTVYGGVHNQGTVFKITPLGVETALYSFSGGTDGSAPYAGVIQGGDGNFYGTTEAGGVNNAGTVFKVTPAGVETPLYSFGTNGSMDGAQPYARLIEGRDGNFYGTTVAGGTTGSGTVFKITSAGVETVLHSFTWPASGSTDGAFPYAGLVEGSDGNFYGTTVFGGSDTACFVGLNGCGVVFKIMSSGVETVLYIFSGSLDGGPDGAGPYAPLIQGSDGYFYGTTQSGGTTGSGTVFKVTRAGVETVLHSFSGGVGDNTDGAFPTSALIEGSDGNFYGTTSKGGGNTYLISQGEGTVFKLTNVIPARPTSGPSASSDVLRERQ